MIHAQRLLAGSAAAVVSLALSATAFAASAPLPAPDGRVDDDAANGLNPGLDAGLADIAGGSTTAGQPAVAWAALEKVRTPSGQNIFVRALQNGQWVTQGSALNLTAGSVAEAPAIDFAGAGRAVPWTTWYEPHGGFANVKQIFAARFAKATNTWIPAGQARVSGPAVPSLNIHTGKAAENPAIAGGAAEPGADPEPWVAWQELSDNVANKNQIFVSKGVKQASDTVTCTGFKPSTGDLTAVGGFCWQQVGVPRLAASSSTDPSLNVDLARQGLEPDIAFTGPSDKVAWAVWYEEGTPTPGLASNKLVFAAKAVADPGADGGFRWVVEGTGGSGVLDTSAGNSMGACAASVAAERACSLNAVATRDAENIRVAAGTQTPGTPTVPWVVWQELVAGKNQVFVARLVGGDRFELFNGGNPVSNTANDATRPDITFSGNVPYVSWVEKVGPTERAFVGHFEGATFVLDTPDGTMRGPAGLQPDQRAPITSMCTANPFNGDGASCQGGAAGSPAYLYLETSPTAGVPNRLFAEGFGPRSVSTGPASDIQATTAQAKITVDAGGAPANVAVEFGATTAYGSRSPVVRVQPGQPTTVTVNLTGLPASTLIHYRAIASGDFAGVTGTDATFTTTTAPKPAPVIQPETSITKAPKKRVVTRSKRAKVTFRFTSDVAGSRFTCRVKPGARLKPCTSPTLFRLRPGRYQFAVQATAPDGQVDPSPAKKRFRVVRKR